MSFPLRASGEVSPDLPLSQRVQVLIVAEDESQDRTPTVCVEDIERGRYITRYPILAQEWFDSTQGRWHSALQLARDLSAPQVVAQAAALCGASLGFDRLVIRRFMGHSLMRPILWACAASLASPLLAGSYRLEQRRRQRRWTSSQIQKLHEGQNVFEEQLWQAGGEQGFALLLSTAEILGEDPLDDLKSTLRCAEHFDR